MSPKPLRILAVGNMYPPHHQGGYELVWQSAMRAARAAGHRVRVLVTTHRERGVHEPDEPDVHRSLHWYWDWHAHAFPQLPIRRRVALERANAAELNRQLASFAPDVVTWWSMGHMSLAMIEQVRRAGVPALFSVHNEWPRYAWDADQWMRIWPKHARAWARVAELSSGIPTAVDIAGSGPLLFNSRFLQRVCADAGIDGPGSRVIHPGISARFQRPLTARPWGWRLLYVGRIDRAKGVDTALAALTALPPGAQLTIYGKGDPDYAAALRREAAAFGDRVSFGEFRDGADLVAAYEQADALLFPVRWEEPWGLVPLEAMGLGRPVVATARGGTAEFVRDGVNALVVAPDDPAAVASAVRRLAQSESLRHRLVDGGRQTAGLHTAERFDAQTVEAIESRASLSASAPARTGARSRWNAPGSGATRRR